MTQNQIDFLLTFFKDERFPGWKNIATNLIEKGEAIVAGDNCIWHGGIGNFIKTESAEGFYGCLKYKFDLEYFLGSAWFAERLNYKIAEVASKKREVDELYTDLTNL